MLRIDAATEESQVSRLRFLSSTALRLGMTEKLWCSKT